MADPWYNVERVAQPGSVILREWNAARQAKRQADQVAREKAACRLSLAAQAMDDAAVYTIDAWCQRMLREHAFDSGNLFEESLVADEAALRAASQAVRVPATSTAPSSCSSPQPNLDSNRPRPMSACFTSAPVISPTSIRSDTRSDKAEMKSWLL